MYRRFASGIVHHVGGSVAECGLVKSENGGVMGLLVYMTR